MGAALTVVMAAAIVVIGGHSHRGLGYQAGDCVMVMPSAGGELHATKTACDTDASFTVAKLADPAGDCTPKGYDRFASPQADPATGSLCLVPNLVAGHCYRFGTAVGIWNVNDCADAGPAAIRVTKRVDADDARACLVGTYLPARTYPAPPRTYCLARAA